MKLPRAATRRRVILTTTIALLSTLVLSTTAPVSSALADQTYEPIQGRGSTWSSGAIDQWRGAVANQMSVNYTADGSSDGRANFITKIVDFAVSEIPFQTNPTDGSTPEQPGTDFAYMPIVAGGTSFMYNLKIGGKRVTNLRLSGETIAKIFTGKITKWNDPQIAGDNPGLAMPDKTITPVVRSDGSGSSAQFSLWMVNQYPQIWNDFCNSGVGCAAGSMTSQYPVFPGAKGQAKSDGVAGYVAQDYGEGAITYVEYSYPLKAKFPVAKVLNSSGYYIEPTASSVAVGMLGAAIKDDLTQDLGGVYNNSDPRAYPLSSYSYLIVPTSAPRGVFTEGHGRTLAAFAKYSLCEGQQQVGLLGYSPLPMNLVQAGFSQIRRIPGGGQLDLDINSCNNPTFKPGDSLESNQLAITAPQPAACDKKGPDQCTTGTAGAPDETPISGSGNGGGSSDAGVNAGKAGAGTAATTAAGGSSSLATDAVYDENGQLVSAAAGGGTAVSAPFTLASESFGISQGLMLAAVALLLLGVFLPPFLSRKLRRSSSSPR